MAKANPAEPAMDHLLASIRRAIDAEHSAAPRDYAPQPQPQATGFGAGSGTPRRFGSASRSFPGSSADSTADDFRQLREKIARELDDLDRLTAGQSYAPAPPQPVPSAAQPPRGLGGAGQSERQFGRIFREPPHASAVQSLQPAPSYGSPRQPLASEPAPPAYRRAAVPPPAQPQPAPQPDYLRASRPHVPAPAAPAPRAAGLLSQGSSGLAASAFARLTDAQGNIPPGLEEMAREMLQPMLRQWLDSHLPSIVERLVREEIERVSRRGSR